ncbi:ATP-dependent zinc protease family protein [Nonlabens xiamenensis]|uniref:ATP-dependent zinc protease family protein n=1 Tax=Nonlabens xiamenensis TaxID=2341043 RepID=UPI0013DE01F8|nr:RimK/LysX family protein [Nonlabens xiamenensis]
MIIGRTDRADFPKLEIKGIDIKIDTGAYTSSIHCKDIEEVDGVLYATLLDEAHEQYHGKRLSFEEYKITSVRSSNGQVDLRYEVQANIRIFKKLYKISLTLSNREEMKYPVLIGRKFLTPKFMVDPELQDVSYLQTQHED